MKIFQFGDIEFGDGFCGIPISVKYEVSSHSSHLSLVFLDQHFGPLNLPLSVSQSVSQSVTKVVDTGQRNISG